VLYLLAFASCIAVGAHTSPDAVWDVADFSVAMLTGINLFALFCMRREVQKETREYFCGK
jgi:Na+/alanine symporter